MAENPNPEPGPGHGFAGPGPGHGFAGPGHGHGFAGPGHGFVWEPPTPSPAPKDPGARRKALITSAVTALIAGTLVVAVASVDAGRGRAHDLHSAAPPAGRSATATPTPTTASPIPQTPAPSSSAPAPVAAVVSSSAPAPAPTSAAPAPPVYDPPAPPAPPVVQATTAHSSPKPSPPPHTSPPTSAAPPSSPPPPKPAGCASGNGAPASALSPIAGTAHTACWALHTEATADDPSRGGGEDLAQLADGAWAEYPKVNFGSGVTQFYGRVACGAAPAVSGLVQVHLDSVTAPPIGSFSIATTGGWQVWRTVPANIAPTSGVHDVYITFDSGQPLPFVSLHWLDFGP